MTKEELIEKGYPPHPTYEKMFGTNQVPITTENIEYNYAPEQTTKEKILEGVNELADTVKVTLGAKGKNVMFNDPITQRPRIIRRDLELQRMVLL
jgi:hypothetical protein